MKKFLLLIMFVLTFSIIFTGQGIAHTLTNSNHSVDSKEIRWGTYRGSTKWTIARDRGITRWDAEGIINIAGDTTSTTEDLSFIDYKAADGTLGFYQTLSGADKIGFNDNYFPSMTACERDFTSLHEIGHALNLEHNTVSGSVLRTGNFVCQSFLGQHDKDDLRVRW